MDSATIYTKIKTAPLLVAYFSFPECGVCKALKPKIIDSTGNFPDAEFLYVDIHKRPDVAGQLLIFSAPTIAIFQQGKELKRFSRHFAVREFDLFLEKIHPLSSSDRD